MTLFIVIISGIGLLTVVLGLANYVKNFPTDERLAILALAAVGVIFIITLALHIGASERSADRDMKLCIAARLNRIAIRTVIVNLEALGDHKPITKGLELAEAKVFEPVNCD